MISFEVAVLVVFFASVYWLSYMLNRPESDFYPPPEPNNMLREGEE